MALRLTPPGLTALAVTALVAAVGSAAPGASRPPGPLSGVPLRGETGLRLLVADNPPFVLDVDSGSVTPLRGVPALTGGVLWVVGVKGGGGAVVEIGRAHV